MYGDSYVFTQIAACLNRNHFNYLANKYEGNRYVKHLSCWNQLLAMMFGQLSQRESLRDLTVVLEAHANKRYHLGLGRFPIAKTTLAFANQKRDYRIFEEFAFYMMEIACEKRGLKASDSNVHRYAFDATSISLCLSIFPWATFRKKKGGIKAHVLYDIDAQVPAFYTISTASRHDSTEMHHIPIEANAFYIFDRAYDSFAELYRIHSTKAFFVVRAKKNLQYKEVGVKKAKLPKNILYDGKIKLTGIHSEKKYPIPMRMVRFYDEEKKRQLVFLTNAMKITAQNVADLYKQRWLVELFFKWLKQHLRIKRFWGTSKNAIRIQIAVAIITYCLVAIIQHDMKLPRSTYETLQIIGMSLTDKTPLLELFDKDNIMKDDSSEYPLFDWKLV